MVGAGKNAAPGLGVAGTITLRQAQDGGYVLPPSLGGS